MNHEALLALLAEMYANLGHASQQIKMLTAEVETLRAAQQQPAPAPTD